jgi:C4-dicarboxylate transporter DctM subunit
MSPITAGIVGIGVLLFLMAFRMPIGFAMALVGFGGVIYLTSLEGAFSVMGMEPFATTSSYTLSVLPLFMLMGQFAFHTGLSERLYHTAYKWLGHLPGGLSMATIGGCSGFAAVCGSSLATAVTMGSVALPEMKRYNYAPTLATGCVAAGGTLGVLIPPSGIFIIYGVLTEQSISELFIAGVFPGILLASLFMLSIYVRVKLNPSLGPPAPATSMREKLASLRGSIDMLALFLLVMGGLYGGIFTPNEAGGVGAAGALLIGVVRRKFTWKGFVDALIETMQTTAMVLAIIIGAMIFNRFLSVSTIPFWLAGFVSGLPVPPLAIIVVIFAIYLVLGCFIDVMAMILLTIPIFYPVVVALGLDPVWFGVIVVIVMEMGMITPPVGLNVYVISGVAKDVPMYTVFRGIIPFLLPMVVCAAILMIFPQIALFLPSTM